MAARFGPHFKLYDVKQHRDREAIERILSGTARADENPSLSFFLQLVRSRVRYVVLELDYIDLDYRAAFSRFHYLRHNDQERRCKRLHFFAETPAKLRLKASNLLSLPQE